MLFETNKQKGNAGLVAAIAYYGMNGYTISIPLNDTQDYDLIIDNGESLLKVQVKATAQRSEYGYSVVSLKSCGGTKGTTYKTVIDTNIDILFVFTELQEMYEIPITDITVTSSLNLGPERQQYRIDNIGTIYNHETKEVPMKYCENCNSILSSRNSSGYCLSCQAKKRRVVEIRPTKEELLKELQSSNFTQVGNKYGVSDNSIRKWCKAYNLPHTIKEIRQYKLE